MNFNKYVALITGERYDANGQVIAEFGQIEGHILIAYDNSNGGKNLKFQNSTCEMDSIQEFYSKIVSNNSFETCSFEDATNNTESDIIVIIPGLFYSSEPKEGNNFVQLDVGEEGNNNRLWYINRNAYRSFLNKIKRIPGAKICNFNFIKNQQINGSFRIPICVNKDLNSNEHVEFTNAIYDFIAGYNNFDFSNISEYMARIFLENIRFDYFISHQSGDKSRVAKRVEELRHDDPFIKIWFDNDIYREEWKKFASDSNQFRLTMQHGIINSEIVFILLSRNYIDKIIDNAISTYRDQNFSYLGVNYELAVILKEQSKVITYMESTNPLIELIRESTYCKKLFFHHDMIQDYENITLEKTLTRLEQRELFENGGYIEFNTISQLQL